MQGLIGALIGIALIFVPLLVVPRLYLKKDPHATVGDVGSLIMLILVLELFVLFMALLSAH